MKRIILKKSVFFLLILLVVGINKVLAGDPNWSVTPASFQYNMTMTAVVNIDCAEQLSPSNRIGVFVGSECRGTALTSQVYNGKYTASLFIYSNAVNGENISFKIYNAAKDTIYDVKVTVEFQQNAAYGNSSAPYIVYSKFPCYFQKDVLPVTNFISPNGDGINDLFEIDDVDSYSDYTLTIYNENGLEVYKKENNYKNDWDAKLDGKLLPTGTYYYLFKNTSKEYKGLINIVKPN
jgi:gliding motility-associated-like protein